MAARYMETAWQADDAALRALACVKSSADGAAVETVRHAIYRPWLEEAAKHFQAPLTTRTWPPVQPAVTAHSGECLLFADGLRYDVGQRFADLAEAAGITVTRNSRWAALPTVTATAKPYVMPVSSKVRGGKLNPDYQPEITATGKVANAHSLRALCQADGYQVLLNGSCGAGDLGHAKGWAEWGKIDHHGLAHGAKLANHLDGQLADLMERVQCLLDAGWRTVRVVTDHGWLLLPGGLPKAELPKFLTDQRWSRCGALKETATAAGHAVISGWTWNPQCWARLRDGSCVSVLQGRVNWGGALSGRDIEAVNKTVSGLVKLIYPDSKQEVPDEELEAMVRMALESRRRVKEVQKRVFKTEFRNSHLSYLMGVDGVEQFVAAPELHSDDAIDSDPLPPGQVWAISTGSGDSPAGLYRIEVTSGPGSGVRVLNNPKPAAFQESVRYGEQNLTFIPKTARKIEPLPRRHPKHWRMKPRSFKLSL